LVAFSPVGRSLLTDAPMTPEQIKDSAFLRSNPRFIEPNYSANLRSIKPFQELAADMGLPAAGLAIAWVLAQGGHITAIPGTRSVTHFDEFVAGWQRQLSQDEVQAVEEVLPVGWAQGDRYNAAQWTGPERYC
jgi:aryl-alcohol dehydrogenase-like predicted oxidoreductase